MFQKSSRGFFVFLDGIFHHHVTTTAKTDNGNVNNSARAPPIWCTCKPLPHYFDVILLKVVLSFVSFSLASPFCWLKLPCIEICREHRARKKCLNDLPKASFSNGTPTSSFLGTSQSAIGQLDGLSLRRDLNTWITSWSSFRWRNGYLKTICVCMYIFPQKHFVPNWHTRRISRGRSLTIQEDLQFAPPPSVPFRPENERKFNAPPIS